MQGKNIAVVGAGISGLTCAYELQKLGHTVTVYEKNSFVGGRMSTRVRQGFYFDLGADHLANVYTHMKPYCEEFGIEWQRMKFLQYNVLKHGELVPLNDVVGFMGKARLAYEFFKTKDTMDFFDLSTTVGHDTDNAYAYSQKYLGQEAADYLCDPFVSTYQFHRADEISLSAFKSFMESAKKERPKWHLHRTKGGMKALPEAFAQQLDVQLETSVQSIEYKDEHVVVELKNGDAYTYDAVVVATTANITKKIVKGQNERITSLLNNAKYAKSVTIAFKVSLDKVPEHSAINWIPYVESKKLTGFVNERYKGEECIQGNTSLLCTWLHQDYAAEMLEKSDEDVFTEVRAELARVCPWVEEADLEPFDLERWPEAMPVFYHGWIKQVAEFLPYNGDKNIFLCGDYLNSPWTEGSLRCGQRVAQQVHNQIS